MRDLVVDLRVNVDDDDGGSGALWWYSEWGTAGDSVGSEHSTTDLGELIDVIVGSAGPGQRLRWVRHDDFKSRPSGWPSVTEALDAAGVVLPEVAGR